MKRWLSGSPYPTINCVSLSCSFMLKQIFNVFSLPAESRMGLRSWSFPFNFFGNISVWLYLQTSCIPCFQCSCRTDLCNNKTMPSVLSFFILYLNILFFFCFGADWVCRVKWKEKFIELVAIVVHPSPELETANLELGEMHRLVKWF